MRDEDGEDLLRESSVQHADRCSCGVVPPLSKICPCMLYQAEPSQKASFTTVFSSPSSQIWEQPPKAYSQGCTLVFIAALSCEGKENSHEYGHDYSYGFISHILRCKGKVEYDVPLFRVMDNAPVIREPRNVHVVAEEVYGSWRVDCDQ